MLISKSQASKVFESHNIFLSEKEAEKMAFGCNQNGQKFLCGRSPSEWAAHWAQEESSCNAATFYI
jgi:hypothetical protein